MTARPAAHSAEPVRIARLTPLEPGDRELVALPMDAHERRRVRRRLTAPDGMRFELALPTGTALPVGHTLHVSHTHAYVITAADETTLVVRPRDLSEAARAGHTIGNLHRDLDVLADGHLVALYDEPLAQRLRAAGFDVSVERRPFLGRAPGEHAH